MNNMMPSPVLSSLAVYLTKLLQHIDTDNMPCVNDGAVLEYHIHPFANPNDGAESPFQTAANTVAISLQHSPNLS